MKSLHLLPAALLFTAALASCGEEAIEKEAPLQEPVTLERVIETPPPAPAPATEVVTPSEERAAEPAVATGAYGMPLMADEMRYRNMDRGYTAEDFERMGVAIEDDMYGGDRY